MTNYIATYYTVGNHFQIYLNIVDIMPNRW